MDATKLNELKEELRRDLEAIERVEKMMALKGGKAASPLSPPKPEATPNLPANGFDGEDAEGSSASVIGTIEALINRNPSVKWTTQKVLAQLTKDGFPLKAAKPIYTIGQSLNKLVTQDKIRRVRKGSGSEPNLYAGKIVKSPQPVLDLSGTDSALEGESKDFSHAKN